MRRLFRLCRTIRPLTALLIAVALAAAFFRPCTAQAAPSEPRPATAPAALIHEGPALNGALRTEGAQLVNASGKPLQLRGMSTHGIHWYPQYANPMALRQLKGLGANLFRVAMYADSEHGAYNESKEARERNLYLLNLAVGWALEEDMYVIIDWHLLKDETPLRHLENARRFFSESSALYAGNPAVIYEICNEPNGDTSWEDIRKYAEQIIPVIRQNSPDALIIVGTPEFSSKIDAVKSAPLAFPNVMYAYHYYPGHAGDGYAPLLEGMLRDGLPVFVTEWGVDKNPQTGELELDKAQEFADFMRSRRISWANWSLSNKDESFSAIASEITKLHGWKEDELTPSGRLVFRALGAR